MENSIVSAFDGAQKIVIISENRQIELKRDSSDFESVLDALISTCNGAHDMPAFGVSLDAETKQEMQTGLWVWLVFDAPQQKDSMKFDSLLIKVEKDYRGFNLLRGNGGKFEGRCFYLSLNGDMTDLYLMATKIAEKGKA